MTTQEFRLWEQINHNLERIASSLESISLKIGDPVQHDTLLDNLFTIATQNK